MPQRIVFLDIDGVVVPKGAFVVNKTAPNRRDWKSSIIQVALINTLCETAHAQVVFNSTHNMHFPDYPSVEDAMITAGLKPEYIHRASKTLYPKVNRIEAINGWWQLEGTADGDWVAFDDADLIAMALSEENFSCHWAQLIKVSSDSGLTVDTVNLALDYFGYSSIIILM